MPTGSFLETEKESENALNQALCEAALDRRLAVESDLARWVPFPSQDRSVPLSLTSGFDLDLNPSNVLLKSEGERLERLFAEASRDISEFCLIPTGRPTPTPISGIPTRLDELLRV